MKLCLLFLLFSTSAFAGVDLSCPQYQEMAPKLELKLMNTSAQNCLSLDSKLLLGTSDESQNPFIQQVRCNDLSLIEADLAKLESEVALLMGFQKLKADLKAEREKLGSNVLISAQEAGKNFKDGVITAHSIELLLSEKHSPEFLKSLKEKLASIPEKDRSDQSIFFKQVSDLCSGKDKRDISACHETFKPTVEAVREINEFLKKGDPTPEAIQSWRVALAIKKTDGSEYSFHQMYQDMSKALPKLSNEEMGLTKEELRALKSLPDFEDASKFDSLVSLKKNRNAFKTQEMIEEFKFLNGDLKARQQYEIQSKVSLAWSKYKADITLGESEKAQCDEAYKDYTQASACLAAFKKALPNTPTSSAKNFIEKLDESLRAGQAHVDLLTKVENQCLTTATLRSARNTGKLSNECESMLPDAETALANKQNQLKVLYALKNNIAKENDRLMTVRNYVIEKMIKNNCYSNSSVIDNCPVNPDLLIAPVAQVLSSDLLRIALVDSKPEKASDIKELCKDEDKLLSYEKRLCDSEEADEDADEPAAPVEVKVPVSKAAEESLDTKRNGSGEVSTAWRQGFVGLASSLAGGLFGPQQSQYGYNPYMYNYSPYPSFVYGTPNIGNSWIQMGAQNYGSFGYYQPTPGMTPYTAFPVYNSYQSIPSSNYFSSYTPIK